MDSLASLKPEATVPGAQPSPHTGALEDGVSGTPTSQSIYSASYSAAGENDAAGLLLSSAKELLLPARLIDGASLPTPVHLIHLPRGPCRLGGGGGSASYSNCLYTKYGGDIKKYISNKLDICQRPINNELNIGRLINIAAKSPTDGLPPESFHQPSRHLVAREAEVHVSGCTTGPPATLLNLPLDSSTLN